MNIRGKTISYATHKKRQSDKLEKTLLEDIEKLEQTLNEDNIDILNLKR